MKTIDDATRSQTRSADPAASTWVSANAGSGKTRVLTDRVARLLLRDVPPQKILCLTYTKAAASHMQNQLFSRLGEWAMLLDAELVRKLTELGEDASNLDTAGLRNARTLFARALETPGGLKIQTIHSFCSALLRRFPLEAGISPQFQEIDEQSGRKLRADLLDRLAESESQAAFDGMALKLGGADPDKLIEEITRHRGLFDEPVDRKEIWSLFDLRPHYRDEDYLAAVFPDWTAEVLVDLIAALNTGKTIDIKNAKKLAAMNLRAPTMELAGQLEAMFVYDNDSEKKNPNSAKTDRFPTKAVREDHPDLIEAVHNLMHQFEDAKPNRLALLAAQKAAALNGFAQVLLPEYDLIKQQHGWLDFDDLIRHANALLTRSDLAQWVLFKLDEGIDHILVDEAQDTSPEQWAVVARLAEEFFAGAGAREVDRTLFVVGDEKQSIYSFQGADPAEFARMRQHFEARLAEAERKMNRRELLFSFRSSSAILRVVDLVFSGSNQNGASGDTLHRAFHSELPGRVDLWPFVESPPKEELPEWFQPVDMPVANDPAQLLANQIADAIKSIIDRKEVITTTKGSRRIRVGDFMILVQRRSALFHGIIKALKDRNLPVAGADRLKVGGELAVRDLTALLSFLVTPEDDLSLAAVLRSPIFRLSEAELFRLAQYRKGLLWPELRSQKSDHPETVEILFDLLGQVDFMRPYELLERVLTRHKGRDNLIARLGKEAEDGIDALLSQAMQYEQRETPSLTGFLGWMLADESDIKRQLDSHSDEIRVMTVHGAKGLESPIVILPDTAKRKPPPTSEIVKMPNGIAVWNTSNENCPAALLEAKAAVREFQEGERMRLLYVAMTRAENWLIVCGAGQKGQSGESWYSHVEEGLAEAGAISAEFMNDEIIRYQPLPWNEESLEEKLDTASPEIEFPNWSHQLAPTVEKQPQPLNPSDLGGAKVVEGALEGLAEDEAKRRGTLIHLLLEALPSISPQYREATAGKIFRHHAAGLDAAQKTELLDEVQSNLGNHETAFLFEEGTLSEVGIAAQWEHQAIDGQIDRLVIESDRILAVDFKSNASVPKGPEETPEGILRQMGAYAEALSQTYPKHRIETAILWTKTASLMHLPHNIVTEAFHRAPTS